MKLTEIDKSYLKFINKTIESSGPYTIMINDGRPGETWDSDEYGKSQCNKTWDSDDNRIAGPFERYEDARSFAERYVELNDDSWVIVLDKHESQVLAHVPWSRKNNKWN